MFSRRYRRFSQIFSRYVYFWHIFSLLLRQIIKRNEWEIWKSLKIHHRQEKLEESARFLQKSLAVNRIFPYFCRSYATGQVKIFAWSGYDAEARQSCGHEQANSSVSWNLVNWNVEGTRICLSESAPSYGVDSSFIFPILRVLPEPNLQGSVERRDSRHSFFACNLARSADFLYLCLLETEPCNRQ